VCIGGWWYLTRITLDRSRARRTAEGRSAAVIADEKKGLSRIVRIRTWLAHELSSWNNTALSGGRRIGDLVAIH